MEQNQTSNSPKWLWITLIVVVLIAAGFFTWFLLIQNKPTVLPIVTPISTPATIAPSVLPSASSSPISTADWKTYTNIFYKISFKYPDNMSAKVYSPVKANMLSPISASQEDPDVYIFESGKTTDPIFGFLSQGETTVNKEIGNLETTNNLNKNDVIINSNLFIAGKVATKVSVPAGKLKDSQEAYDFYFIPVSMTPNIQEIYQIKIKTTSSIANQILSTFQFTP